MTALLNYLAPERHYHNMTHVGYMLDGMKYYYDVALPPGANTNLKHAILYHDVIYVPGAWDNEFQSAVVAAQEIPELTHGDLFAQFGVKAKEIDINEIQRLIMLTKDHKPAVDDVAGQIICDLDLAGLGGSQELYESNRKKIRKEFSTATDEQWAEGRKKFLRSYLDRDTIYHTDHGKKNWEAKARENMGKELDSLILPFY